MKQATFVQRRQADWEIYREQLKLLARRRGEGADGALADFPQRYRAICNDLALARSRGYSLALVEQLETLVRDGHARLYRPRSSLGHDVAAFFAAGFPARVRADWKLVAVCSLLLFGPILWLGAMIGQQPEFVYRVLDAETVATYERMYAAEHRGRSGESDVFMFAFYIANNVGVALRTFAAGLLFGIGAAAILLVNGVQIGAIGAHLTWEGYQASFLSFVVGHGAFELPAIALAGVAGARMGLSLLFPGPRSRADALRAAAGGAVQLLYGVIAMLLAAAGLEAFWSASPAPPTVKYAVGGVLWVLVIGYFALAGRRTGRGRDAH